MADDQAKMADERAKETNDVARVANKQIELVSMDKTKAKKKRAMVDAPGMATMNAMNATLRFTSV